MKSLPQLLENDIRLFDAELQTLLEKTGALAALIVDEAGFVITSRSQNDQFDLTTIGALASGTFLASQSLAALVPGNRFTSIYQPGREFSMLVVSVVEYCLLVIIFNAANGVGVVKLLAMPLAARLAAGLEAAQSRPSAPALDLPPTMESDLGDIFGRKM